MSPTDGDGSLRKPSPCFPEASRLKALRLGTNAKKFSGISDIEFYDRSIDIIYPNGAFVKDFGISTSFLLDKETWPSMVPIFKMCAGQLDVWTTFFYFVAPSGALWILFWEEDLN